MNGRCTRWARECLSGFAVVASLTLTCGARADDPANVDRAVRSADNADASDLLPTLDGPTRDALLQFADSLTRAAPTTDAPLLPAVLRGLVGVRRLDVGALSQRASVGAVPSQSIGDQSVAAHVLRIRGRARRLTAIDTPEPWTEVADLPRCWVLRLESTAEDGAAVEAVEQVMLASAPAGWPTDARIAEIDEPVEVLGVRVGEQGRGGLVLAHSLQWFPRTAQPQPPVTPAQALLGRGGVDIAALLAAQARNQQPLTAADGPPLRALLRIAGEPLVDEFRKVSVAFDLPQLLVAPAQWAGAAVQARLRARRATRVELSPDEEHDVGADHYWQIDAFIELDRQTIRLQGSAENAAESLDFNRSFPVTVLVRDLPDAWIAGDARAVTIDQPFDLLAIHYRLWGYETPFSQQAGAVRQWGPLLVALELQPRPISTTDSPVTRPLQKIIGACLSLALIPAVGALWWSWRQRARRVRSLPDRLTIPPLDPYSESSAGAESPAAVTIRPPDAGRQRRR